MFLFFILKGENNVYRSHASYALPESHQQILTDINNFHEAPTSVRFFHCIKTFLYGLCIYLLIMILGTISVTLRNQFTSFSDMLISSSPFLAVIMFFTLISWFKVGPWYKVYHVKAYISNPSGLDYIMRYVVFYDHKNQEYSTGRIHLYKLFLAHAHKDCDMVDIILYKTPKKLKVVGIYPENILTK